MLLRTARLLVEKHESVWINCKLKVLAIAIGLLNKRLDVFAMECAVVDGKLKFSGSVVVT